MSLVKSLSDAFFIGVQRSTIEGTVFATQKEIVRFILFEVHAGRVNFRIVALFQTDSLFWLVQHVKVPSAESSVVGNTDNAVCILSSNYI